MPYSGDEKPSIEDLEHYGIKGMKWGVRKADAYASTETRKERKAARNNLQNYMWDSWKDEPLFNYMTEDDYKAMNSKGATYAKGVTLRRVQHSDQQTMNGAIYVSKLLKDSEFYKAAIPSYGPEHGVIGGGQKRYKNKPYEVEMTTLKKLSLPSEKERFDTFVDLLSQPAVKVPNKDLPITGRQYLESVGYKVWFGTESDREFALRTYKDGFLAEQGNQENPINKAYFDKLSSKGYNALIDSNDAGRVAKNPLIILDSEKNVKVNSVRRLTADEINKAQRSLTKEKE